MSLLEIYLTFYKLILKLFYLGICYNSVTQLSYGIDRDILSFIIEVLKLRVF